jgi:hypothetical protein
MTMWIPGRVAFSTAFSEHDVRFASAAKREYYRLFDGGRHLGHRLEVALRRRREACLDDVDAELLELTRHHHLFLDVHRGAGRLLAVPKRGVEDLHALSLKCAVRVHGLSPSSFFVDGVRSS